MHYDEDPILDDLLAEANANQAALLEELRVYLRDEYSTNITVFTRTESPIDLSNDFWFELLEEANPQEAFDNFYSDTIGATRKKFNSYI